MEMRARERGYRAFNLRFPAVSRLKYFIIHCRLQIYVRSHIIIADLRDTAARARTSGMRARGCPRG